MYVKAPFLGQNGNVTVMKNNIGGFQSTARYNTIAQPLADVETFNSTTSTISGFTKRTSMQNGRTGPERFRNTSYSCEYKNYKSWGNYKSVRYDPATKKYYGRSEPLGFGYSGFLDSGCSISIEELDPNGTLNSVAAVYNRAVIGNLVNRCKVECRQKAMNVRMDASESLTGLKATVLMIAKRSSQVIKAYGAVRRKNIPAAFRHLGLDYKKLNGKDAASLWLELYYGWIPLLVDIYNGAQLVKEYLDPVKKPQQFYATRRGREDLMVTDPLIPSVWKRTDVTKKGEAEVEVKYRFRVVDAFWAQLNSFSVLNPLYVAWISIPYTFVVDWFVPIADMLQAMTSSIGLQFTSGYTTIKSFGFVQAQAWYRPAGGNIILAWEDGKASARAEVLYMRRSALTSFPFILPYIRFPFSSDQRIASAIALLEQRRK